MDRGPDPFPVSKGHERFKRGAKCALAKSILNSEAYQIWCVRRCSGLRIHMINSTAWGEPRGRLEGNNDCSANRFVRRHALMLLEGRAIPEFGAFLGALPLLSLAPRGDGHPVLVLPGLVTSDVATSAAHLPASARVMR